MTENRPRIVIYDSSGKRYASTPEKWTEACEAQMNEKAIMEFIENQSRILDVDRITLFSLKNRLIKATHEDGCPLGVTEAGENIAEIEETIWGAEAALKIAKAEMRKRAEHSPSSTEAQPKKQNA